MKRWLRNPLAIYSNRFFIRLFRTRINVTHNYLINSILSPTPPPHTHTFFSCMQLGYPYFCKQKKNYLIMDEISNTDHSQQNQKAFDNKPGNSRYLYTLKNRSNEQKR
jgi:hypothetical protein